NCEVVSYSMPVFLAGPTAVINKCRAVRIGASPSIAVTQTAPKRVALVIVDVLRACGSADKNPITAWVRGVVIRTYPFIASQVNSPVIECATRFFASQ